MARQENEFAVAFRRLWPVGIVVAISIGILAAFVWTFHMQ
jgi:hypothetical protein